MAQTTINYDKLIEIYSNPVTTYRLKTKERSKKNTTGILQMLRNLCNLSRDEISDKELIKEMILGLIAGLVTLPLIPFLIIFLEILVA